jgi:murein DD-endopeptidase MepM/ murein hydrolase activator NlpD
MTGGTGGIAVGRRMRRVFAAAVCLILAALAVAAPLRAAMGADDLGEKEQELQELQKGIEDYRQQIQSKKKAEASVLAELERLEQQLNLSTKELNYIEARLSYMSDQVQRTRDEIATIEGKLGAQKEAFNARLTSMYKAGRVSYVDILLASGSLSEFMSRLHYLREIAAQDNALIAEYSANRSELLAKRQELESGIVELASLKESEQQKRADVTSGSQERERYLARVQADRQQLEQALDEAERQSAALEKVIRDLQARSQKAQVHPLSMMWPVSGGWISSYYGNRLHPILGYYRWHSGIDYAADSGTPIKAMEDGTVILAGDNGSYGNCVIIDHGGGVSTLYGHASRILVKKGQDVLKGQTVALVGSTGLSTGPHLHFEVRVNGSTQDPLKWLP